MQTPRILNDAKTGSWWGIRIKIDDNYTFQQARAGNVPTDGEGRGSFIGSSRGWRFEPRRPPASATISSMVLLLFNYFIYLFIFSSWRECWRIWYDTVPYCSFARGGLNLTIYPRARFAKDVSLLTIWPTDTHRQGLGVD
jgi:hypothetical protein